MAEINDLSRAKQIRNLLFILCSGMGTALAFAFAVLYFYSPSGSYLAKNVLLSPESVLIMRYADMNSKTGSTSRYVFDSIEFSYYSTSLVKWVRLPVDMQKYTDFYTMIADERSLVNADQNSVNIFLGSAKPSMLTIMVKAEKDDLRQVLSKTFLTIEFAGDYYRITLRDHNSQEGQAYFYHPGIYQQVLKLFVPS